jgi:hypothetical protein
MSGRTLRGEMYLQMLIRYLDQGRADFSVARCTYKCFVTPAIHFLFNVTEVFLVGKGNEQKYRFNGLKA